MSDGEDEGGDDGREEGAFEWDIVDDGDGTDPPDAPLDDLADRVRARTATRSADAEASADDDLFERVEVTDLDRERIWSALEGDDEAAFVGVGADARQVGQAGDASEHVVPKRDYCQQCPHFSEPPETACTHGGTEIVEVVDTDSFLVRACPMVEQDADGGPS